MRIFKTKGFEKFCRSERVENDRLVRAVVEMEAGLIDAHLGGVLFKKRIARAGQGKSGGYRTLLAFRADHRVVFVFGFAKNERDNVGELELAALRKLSEQVMEFDDAEVSDRVNAGSWIEVTM